MEMPASCPHRVYILTIRGTFLSEVGKIHHPAPERTWNNWFPKPYTVEIKGEKVWEAILRSNEADKKPYSEDRRPGPRPPRDDYFTSPYYIVVCSDNGYVTVYKPPENDLEKLLALAKSFDTVEKEYLDEIEKIQSA